jgi:adenine-specific DNA-methyltransferase
LSYLRDRLVVAKELLADTGSVFVQIGVENVHRLRLLMDEVFYRDNFVSLITVKKTATPSSALDDGAFYLLWYARDSERMKFRPLYLEKPCEEWARETPGGSWGAEIDGIRRSLTPEEKENTNLLPSGAKVYCLSKVTSAGPASEPEAFEVFGQSFPLSANEHWKTGKAGRERLVKADRIEIRGRAWFTRFYDDGQFKRMNNIWEGTAGKSSQSLYVVQTQPDVIANCILMTTDPGDLVLDPTCGSATTAYAAEQWGRRWISIDTSRVAVAIARQRLLTAKYDYFKIQDESHGVASGLRCRKVPHLTLKSVAQNTNLDPIFAKHEPILEAERAAANAALKRVSDRLRNDLRSKLALKQKQEGKKAITEADRRRWDLPKQWQHWEVPFDTDADYPADLKKAVEEYRAAWRAKMAEVNACIAANAEQEELVDQPEVDRKITRVSGPFTVEAVQPPEMSLGDAIEVNTGQFAGEPEELGESFVIREVQMGESAQNIEAYLAKMVELLRMDGVRFPDNKHMKFTRLDPIYASGGAAGIHAEGRWVNMGESDPDPEGDATVGVVFGPQYGPITAKMIEEVIKPASRRYDDLVFAGFSFDGPAQAVIDEGHPRLRMHLAHVRPDVNPGMNGLLKEQPGSQLFTVFGRPRTTLDGPDGDGMYRLAMEGVDIYDPVSNAIVDTGATKVAAWFVDGDYDGRTFCMTQAFFPDRSAWEKLSKALKGVVDPDRFEAFTGTTSLPFSAGQHKCAAVKVIDPRGNEVMRVHPLVREGK